MNLERKFAIFNTGKINHIWGLCDKVEKQKGHEENYYLRKYENISDLFLRCKFSILEGIKINED